MRPGFDAIPMQFTPGPALQKIREAFTLANKLIDYKQSPIPPCFSPRPALRSSTRSNFAHYIRQAAASQATGKQLKFSTSKSNQGPVPGREFIFPG